MLIWKNPMPHGQGRRASLIACMIATHETIVEPLLKKPGTRTMPGVTEAMEQVKAVKLEVLEGKAKLADFREACERLVSIVEREEPEIRQSLLGIHS